MVVDRTHPQEMVSDKPNHGGKPRCLQEAEGAKMPKAARKGKEILGVFLEAHKCMLGVNQFLLRLAYHITVPV